MSVSWGGCVLTLLLILMGLVSVKAQISDLRLCADPECKEPISKGHTVIGYPSNDKRVLSFPINAEVIVYSKEAGSRLDLWGVEIKGKRGYVPKQYIREQKIFKSKLEYEVPTEGPSDGSDSASDTSKTRVTEEESQKDDNIPKSTVNEERTEHPVEQTEHPVEEIALSAEDVEYNRLKESALNNENKDPHKDDVKVYSENAAEDGKINNEENVKEEEELGNNDNDEEEDEEYGDDGEYEEEEEKEEENKGEEEEEVEVVPDEIGGKKQKVDLPSVEQKDKESERLDDGSNTVNDSETSTESAPIPSKLDTHVNHLNTDDEPPLPVDYEVIDGTTIYFDDATPLPPTAEVIPSLNLMSSSATDKEYVTAHPPLLLSQAAYEGVQDQNAEIQVTTTLSPDVSKSVVVDGTTENIVTEAPVEATETLPSEREPEKSIQIEEAEQTINPTSSWLADATATVSSWFGGNEEKGTDDDDDSEDFGNPKAQSIIDRVETTSEDVKQNDGFFSSWFGSTEAPEVPKDQELSNESSKDTDITKSDKTFDEQAEVKANRVNEDSSTEESETDPIDTIIPSDTMQTPVEPAENPEIYVQPPYAADDVDNVYSTQRSTLSSVDTNPETPATPDPDLDPENPLKDHELHSAQEPSSERTTSVSRQEDPSDDTGDDEDPSTSTARPMYAAREPPPSSQDYLSHSHVEPDELAHLAGEGAVMDGSESCDSETPDASLSEEFLKTSHNLLPEGLAFGFEAEVAEPHVSSGMLVFLLIVSGTVVTIYIVHFVMMKVSREAPLLEALNRMDQENRMKMAEADTLLAELVKARSELEIVASSVSTSSREDVEELNAQLEIVKNEYANEKNQLEERVVQLEHELEETTTNGLEMHKMLSEMLASEKDASAFQASVDQLQSMLDGGREKVEALTSDLALKNRLNEELHSELSSSMERASKLDYQVEQLTHSLEELTGVKGEANRKLQEEAAVVKGLREANTTLKQQAGEYDSKVSMLTDELSDLRDTINQLCESVETKESELLVSKECLKQLRLTAADDNAAPDEEKLSALFDVIRVKAELKKVNNDRLTLAEQLQDTEMARKNLEDTMRSIRTEVSELRTHHDVAIKEKQDAMSKLEVLTKYFEEKEAQLTKELESQEGLRVNAEGSAAVVAKKIQNYGLELTSYKTQVESLRKELEEQESSYKTQITSHEQKAHDNWLQARSAERKHEEHRQENSQLRGRLTMLQKEKEEVQQSQLNIIKPTPKRVDANGTMSSPRPMVDGIDGDHSGPLSLHRDLDSPPIPPHPLHGPPILPMMFPPGGPLPPGVPPPHGLPPGVPPPPHGLPHGVPPPHGLPHGVPPPHGLPPHPFLPGEPPFMGPLPPHPGDRRLPPAGGMSPPPFRRSGSPSYDHRNDRYSPISDRSHVSDRRYSPPPLRRRPLSPDMHRNRSPDRRPDRMRSPDRRSDRIMRSPDHRNDRRSPDRRLDRRSPDRHYQRSPDGYMRHRTSPRNYYDEPDYNNDDSRLRSHHIKGKKTSTPLGPGDR